MRRMGSSWTVLVGCLAACSAMAACSAEPDVPAVEQAEVAKGTANEETVLGWVLDTTELRRIPVLAAPAARAAASAFEPGRVQRDLLGSSEPFQAVTQVRSRGRLESSAFVLELDPTQGKLLALRKDAPAAVMADVDDGALTSDARSRLRALGIPDDEVVDAVTRRLLAQDDARDTQAAPPRLVTYKTFVWRGFGGVRVEGHRAVVTHDPDGSLRKVLMHWPALAESGHRLRTPLTIPEIQRQAATQLTSLGRRQGRASLSWTQIPSVDPSGAVRLTLAVAARLPAVDRGEIVEEPEVETIDVAAIE